MPRPLLAAVATLAALALTHHDAAAQKYQQGGELNSCLTTFYDPDMYNWYSIRNSCGERIHVVYCRSDLVNRICSSTTIRPGTASSTGDSRREMASKGGGYILYACRAGYLPVDANDEMVGTGPQRQFKCRRSDY